ncbi:MAG: hypothetical protein ABSG80_07620 [Verrucomicrobiota bacterium]|jgi:hypothetical protein
MNFERITSIVIPILTLVLGWSLNSFTPIFEARRENRKALSKAIADLLEIRHRLLAEKVVMEQIKKMLPLTPVDERAIRNLILQVLPQANDLSKRFDETVTLIASVDPLLGFQLRSKDFITKIGGFFVNLEAKAGTPLPPFTEFESHISRMAIPHLNEVILHLSWRHGLCTWLKVKNLLKKNTGEVPKELESMMESMKVELQKQQAASTQITPAPVPQPTTIGDAPKT